jgi:CHAD domain-containing protein
MADREIEAKFTLTDAAIARGLAEWPTLAYRYPLTAPESIIDVDTYFDTADRRLLRTGRTLRVRRHDGALFVTAKSIELDAPKGMHVRKEFEREAPEIDEDSAALTLQHLPDEVAAFLSDSVKRKQPLLPFCRLQQQRTKRNVLHPNGGGSDGGESDGQDQILAELSIDALTVLRPDWPDHRTRKGKRPAGPPAWTPVASYDELEAELKGDTRRGELKEVAASLRDLPGVKANSQNKLQQALVALAEAGEGDSDTAVRRHIAELCRRVWAQQLAQMLVTEAGVRDSDDIEYVHEMRVATRRARAAGRLYGSYFAPKNRRVRRFMDQLRTTGRRLGAVRDLDVALARLQETKVAAEAGHRHGIDELARHWREQRDDAHARLLKWLDSEEYAAFIADFDDFVRTPGEAVAPFRPVPGEAPPPFQLRHTIPSMVLSSYEGIRAFEVLFEAEEPIPVETLHALRIECKYLRYHLEFNQRLLGSQGADLIATLKALQEDLGRLNDASVALEMLADAREESILPDDIPFGDDDAHLLENPWEEGGALHGYVAEQESIIAQQAAQLPGDLERFLSLGTRERLADALARI